MTRVHHVEHARKDYPEAGIKKGESYYWWKHRFGAKHRSKTMPTRQQLTMSDFLSQIWDIEDTLHKVDTSEEDFQSIIDEVVSELEGLRDECQDKLDNMPEALQETSDSGQILQNRIDSVDSMIDELENIDVEVNEDEIREDIEGNYDMAKLSDKEKQKVEEEVENAIEERKQEVIDELQNISYEGD